MRHLLLEVREKRKPEKSKDEISQMIEENERTLIRYKDKYLLKVVKELNKNSPITCMITIDDILEDAQRFQCIYRDPKRCHNCRSFLYPFVCDKHSEVLYPNLNIKESNILNAGMGLFAKKLIPKGTIIGYYYAKENYIKVFGSNDKSQRSENENAMQIFLDKTLGMIEALPLGRDSNDTVCKFINTITKDSGSQNVAFMEENDLIVVRSIENIEAGTELLIYYGQSYWDK